MIVYISFKGQGTIHCLNMVTDKISAHEIFNKNSIHIVISSSHGGGEGGINADNNIMLLF